ncbi:MAG: hypothetical protein JXO49_07380 [Deltaproteobacteria bacterium]|nr:hypothetical protein [Candidatus Anaeroferrophillus wilburensis]MBN2889150.1 hypothetical protein [Deltaproteobacteria bacterium]
MSSMTALSSCEDYLARVLVEGTAEVPAPSDHLVSCSRCRQQKQVFDSYRMRVQQALEPSDVALQRIRSRVWETLERQECRWRFFRQPVWSTFVILLLLVATVVSVPLRLPRLAVLPPEHFLFADSAGLQIMVDELVPLSAASEPAWIGVLGGGVWEEQDAEQLDDLIEMVMPERGEQT